MKKSGFSLIEVIIAMMIGAILSLMLYRLFQQTAAVTVIVAGTIEDYSNTLIFSHEIERDMFGVVLNNVDSTDSSKSTLVNPRSLIASAKSNTEQKKENKPFFEAVVQDNQFQRLSLVTTNALPQPDRWSSSLVRVTYRLADQPNGLFQLMRSEEPFFTSKDGRGSLQEFPLLSDIVQIKITFYMYEIKEAGQPTLKTLSSWDKEESGQIPAPEFIKIEGICKSPTTGFEISFDGLYQLPAARLVVEQQRKKKSPQTTPSSMQQGQLGKESVKPSLPVSDKEKLAN